MTGDADLGFDWSVRKDGTLVILRNGATVTEMRGKQADKAVARLHSARDGAAQQQILARLTGNYKRGNERLAKGARNG